MMLNQVNIYTEKKNEPQHLPYRTHKIHLTWIVDPNVKAKTIKCLEDMR